MNPEEVALWGEVPDGPVEIPDESEPEQQQEQPEETLAASEEEPGMMSVIPGSETQLRFSCVRRQVMRHHMSLDLCIHIWKR